MFSFENFVIVTQKMKILVVFSAQSCDAVALITEMR